METDNNFTVQYYSLSQFFDERCELGSNHVEPKAAFYAAYQSWAQDSGQIALPAPAMGHEMASRGIIEYRTKAARCWKGLRLKATVTKTDEAAFETFLTPDPKVFLPEAVSLKVEHPATEKVNSESVRKAFRDESAVEDLLRRRMMGLFETQQI